MEESPHSDVLILDHGSSTIRAGRMASAVPTLEIPALFAMGESGVRLVGVDALILRADRPLSPVFQKAIAADLSCVEDIWTAVTTKLEIKPSCTGLFLLDNGTAPVSQRKKTLELAFEKFAFRSAVFASTPVSAMYCTGGDTGLVLECGNSISQTVPMYRGYCIGPGMMRTMIGGADVTELLAQRLLSKGAFPGKNFRLAANEAKEKYGSTANGEEASTAVDVELPDGKKVTLQGQELKEPGELLFRPGNFSMESDGVVELCMKSVARSDLDTRAELYKNIILIGGSTLLPGFAERLRAGIKAAAPGGVEVNVQEQHNRLISAWMGAYIIACTELFQALAVRKEDYEERGADIVSKFYLY